MARQLVVQILRLIDSGFMDYAGTEPDYTDADRSAEVSGCNQKY